MTMENMSRHLNNEEKKEIVIAENTILRYQIITSTESPYQPQ